MKKRNRNIITLTVVLLLASFSVSFSHTIIEQIGSHCHQHESHDFSKVMSDTALTTSGNSFSSGASLQCILPNSLFNIPFDTPALQKELQYSVPLVYYDKLFITKYRTLLI